MQHNNSYNNNNNGSSDCPIIRANKLANKQKSIELVYKVKSLAISETKFKRLIGHLIRYSKGYKIEYANSYTIITINCPYDNAQELTKKINKEINNKYENIR